MKCKGCGAEYKARELKCPYCNRENLLGKLWQIERTEAEKDYENEKDRVKKIIFSPYMADRLLSRALVIIAGLYIVSFLVVVLVFFLDEKIDKIKFKLNKDEIVAQMEEYHSAGEYELLDIYMEKKNVNLKDFYAYTQATLLNYDYNRYMEYRLGFMALSEEEKLKDDFYLKYSIEKSRGVYLLDCGIYDDLVEENRELYEDYQKEIMAYWVGTLKLFEEEIGVLADDGYLYPDVLEDMMEGIKARGCR